MKRTDSTGNWFIEDANRAGYNPRNYDLLADTSDIEQADEDRFDFLSNGFKCRNTTASSNASGGTFIYLAFAKYPFKYANAR